MDGARPLTPPQRPLEDDDTSSQLVSEMMEDAEDLIRQHIELAKAEVRESIGAVSNVGKMMAVAGVLGFFGLYFLLYSAAIAIHHFTDLSLWAAFGIVTLICLLSAGVVFAAARNKMKSIELQPLPETTKAIKEDVTWLTKTVRLRR